jgi:hypothetical protein
VIVYSSKRGKIGKWVWELLEMSFFILAKNPRLGGFIGNSWRYSKSLIQTHNPASVISVYHKCMYTKRVCGKGTRVCDRTHHICI